MISTMTLSAPSRAPSATRFSGLRCAPGYEPAGYFGRSSCPLKTLFEQYRHAMRVKHALGNSPPTPEHVGERRKAAHLVRLTPPRAVRRMKRASRASAADSSSKSAMTSQRPSAGAQQQVQFARGRRTVRRIETDDVEQDMLTAIAAATPNFCIRLALRTERRTIAPQRGRAG